MHPLAVLSAPLDIDLSPLTQHLWAERIVHRVIEENDQQILILGNPEDQHRVKELLEQWQNGDLQAAVRQPDPSASAFSRVAQVPLTVALIVLLVAVFGWQNISDAWQVWAVPGADIWPEMRNSFSAYTDIGFWSMWRPTLLHFSILHLVFNALWFWVFAGAMERHGERGGILAVFILAGLAGNCLQWWLTGPAFGGASGAVYGLAAFTGLRQTVRQVSYGVPRALLVIMVAFMLLSITTDTLFPSPGGTGNGAHLGGLLCGFVLAMIWPVSQRGKHES